jgi:AraC-like DNA-binding protein
MPREGTTTRRRQLLAHAHSVVRQQYRDPDLTLKDVAREVGASVRHVQRVFREEGSEDFRRYLLRVRMERAAKLLSRQTNPLPVVAVARQVGYRQASGLRQAFVRFYGHNPSAIQAAPAQYLGTLEGADLAIDKPG